MWCIYIYVCVCVCVCVYVYPRCDIHNGILLSHKKCDILLFATAGMDPEGIMLSEISQMEKN